MNESKPLFRTVREVIAASILGDTRVSYLNSRVYDILSALRGPDGGGPLQDLKWCYVEPLRALVYSEQYWRVGILFNANLPTLENARACEARVKSDGDTIEAALPPPNKADMATRRVHIHFINHLRDAYYGVVEVVRFIEGQEGFKRDAS